MRLEDACYLLLARQAPVAGDLRRVVAILRSVADVQRSASLLRHVGESLTWVHPPSMPDELRKTIAELGEATAEILCGAVRAWQSHDGLAAVDLNVRDDRPPGIAAGPAELPRVGRLKRIPRLQGGADLADFES